MAAASKTANEDQIEANRGQIGETCDNVPPCPALHDIPSESWNGKVNFNCRYCKFKTNIQTDYEHHSVIKHPGRAGY